jgi:hypothetical protein
MGSNVHDLTSGFDITETRLRMNTQNGCVISVKPTKEIKHVNK